LANWLENGKNSHEISSREGAVRTVNVADLKDLLSAYLRQVREGEEILIKDRTRPVALIVPLSARNDVDADIGALVASGRARPPESITFVHLLGTANASYPPRAGLRGCVG